MKRSRSKKSPNPLGWIIGGVLVIGSLFLINQPPSLSLLSQRAQNMTLQWLKRYEIKPEKALMAESTQQHRSGGSQWRFVQQQFLVPPTFNWDAFRQSLERSLEAQELMVTKISRQKDATHWLYQMDVGTGSTLLYRLILKQPFPPEERKVEMESPPVVVGAVPAPLFPKGKGKIAIVLDDWGYGNKQVSILKMISQPLTVAVLPGLSFSGEVAKAAHSVGHEVILHQPMEAKDSGQPQETRVILTGMNQEQMIQQLNQSLASVPFARGVNNHQGSKITSSRTSMEVILGEVKRQGLYFLDSFVTADSVCEEVAADLKLKFARRSVFLDNDNNPVAIRQQLVELTKTASQQGQAIGIGHDRPHTLQVLRDSIPDLVKAGYTLVPASQLTRVPSLHKVARKQES